METIEEPLKSPWRNTKKDSKGSSTNWTIPRVPLPRFRGKPWEEEGGSVTLKSTFYCLGKVQNCRGYRLVGASRSTSSALEKVQNCWVQLGSQCVPPEAHNVCLQTTTTSPSCARRGELNFTIQTFLRKLVLVPSTFSTFLYRGTFGISFFSNLPPPFTLVFPAKNEGEE